MCILYFKYFLRDLESLCGLDEVGFYSKSDGHKQHISHGWLQKASMAFWLLGCMHCFSESWSITVASSCFRGHVSWHAAVAVCILSSLTRTGEWESWLRIKLYFLTNRRTLCYSNQTSVPFNPTHCYLHISMKNLTMRRNANRCPTLIFLYSASLSDLKWYLDPALAAVEQWQRENFAQPFRSKAGPTCWRWQTTGFTIYLSVLNHETDNWSTIQFLW